EGFLPEGWENTVMIGLPPPKKEIHIRLDTDILDWFKSHGTGYQARINAVLRSYVQARQRLEYGEQKHE
ncbi:MAG: BrnA antitoxin family protein, partial [Methylococcales bacterium]